MATHAPMLNQAASQQPPGDLLIKFWGVRGSVPTPGAATARYGGNTPCVEVISGDQRLIFDGGTGLRVLGEALHGEPAPVQAHIFFTNSQWDRIQGFPFFLPAFFPGNCFHIYGGTATNGASIKQCLTTQMLKPGFALPMQSMQANLDFTILQPGGRICLGEAGETTVEVIGLNSQVNAFGYRISRQGRSIVYATDTNPDQLDENLVYLAQGADVLIYDGTYADLSDQGAKPRMGYGAAGKAGGPGKIYGAVSPRPPADRRPPRSAGRPTGKNYPPGDPGQGGDGH